MKKLIDHLFSLKNDNADDNVTNLKFVNNELG